MAAGGIVTRSDAPLIAVVRLRKRDHWVLPKGKLDPGETARVAAEREVLEETGHDVAVHEFVGTMAYDVGGRVKIVHFWRMEAEPTQSRELMRDIRAVIWLPLEAAIAQLTRPHEQAFLTQIGPTVVATADAARRARGIDGEIVAPSAVPAPDADVVAEAGPSAEVLAAHAAAREDDAREDEAATPAMVEVFAAAPPAEPRLSLLARLKRLVSGGR